MSFGHEPYKKVYTKQPQPYKKVYTRQTIMASTFKDDWRYIGCDMWRLDALSGTYESAEDDIINGIDNVNMYPLSERRIPMITWLQEELDERQFYIINNYIWNGRSMSAIGDDLGITRVRVWQIYKEVFQIIRDRCGDSDVYRELFIGN